MTWREAGVSLSTPMNEWLTLASPRLTPEQVQARQQSASQPPEDHRPGTTGSADSRRARRHPQHRPPERRAIKTVLTHRLRGSVRHPCDWRDLYCMRPRGDAPRDVVRAGRWHRHPRSIPEKITEITSIIIINTATQPIFDQKFLCVRAIVLLIVDPIFMPSTIIIGNMKR